MIKLNKQPHQPIYTHGKRCKLVTETNKLVTEYNKYPTKYISGSKKFKINNCYSHDNIKTKLIQIQNNKCAFCEDNLTTQYGDIEHFRPKGMYMQNTKDTEHYPGYYWLSYDWNNLLLSCIRCNQIFKKNLFPIKHVIKRAINHSYNTKKEKPYLINPYTDFPSKHLKFEGALIKGIDKCNRGKVTIKILELNKNGENGINELYEERYSLYEKHRLLKEAQPSFATNRDLYNRIEDNLRIAKSPNQRFSKMIIDNF